MLFRYPYHGGVWVDLEHPTESEIQKVAREFSIGERLVSELISPTPSSLVASDADMVFLVLHFPSKGLAEGELEDQEIDFIVGDNFILTVRHEVIASLHHLHKLLETQQLVSSRETLGTGVLLEILFAHLYTAVRDHVTAVAERLAEVERQMFGGLERTTVRPISNLSREFLHIEALLETQEEALCRFLKTCEKKRPFGAAFSERIERILAERSQVARLASTHRAIATELRETNASLLETAQNTLMKQLTVITFIFLPLELIALIFAIHAIGTPFESHPQAFWIIMAIMAGVAGVMTLLASKKHWLS